eukprot:UN29576
MLNKLEQRHNQTMTEFKEQEEVEKSFWNEVKKMENANLGKIDQLLIKKADINWVENGLKPLDLAVENECKKMIGYVKSKGGVFTPAAKELFLKSAEQGNIKKMELWLGNGIKLTKKEGGLALLRAIRKKQDAAVKYFLDNRLADLNVKDWVDGTPLMGAAHKGNLGLVKMLLKAKADLSTQSRWGGTALTIALNAKNHEVVDYLISQGADVNKKGKNGISCLIGLVQQNQTKLVETVLNQSGIEMEASFQ